jgi:DNA gyrase/topoisomerase IV subunit B
MIDWRVVNSGAEDHHPAKKKERAMLRRSDDESSPYSDGRGIEILSWPEAVRRRPTMYLGSTDQRALHQLLIAVLEGLLWHYRGLQTSLNQVTIRLEQDGSATMTCQGSTLSEMFLEQSAQILLRDLQSTFRQTPLLAIANALCECLSVTVRGVSNQWRSFVFKQGILQKDELHGIPPPEMCDIWLRLWPDFTLLDPGAFDYEGTQEAMRSFSEGFSTLSINVTDVR